MLSSGMFWRIYNLEFIIESTWKSQESSSNSKHAYILSCYIINREVYNDRIYDVTTENEAIDLQNEN